MSRLTIFFLVVLAPALAVVLALLGHATHENVLLGWFLLLVGVSYAAGTIVVYWIRRDAFWQPRGAGAVVLAEGSDRSFWALLPGMIAAFFASPLEYLYLDPLLPREAWLEAFGLVLVLAGSLIFLWARYVARLFYSAELVVLEGQQLIRGGPYGIIRHPAYAGFLLMALGIALGYSSLAGILSVVILLVPGVLYRIRREDRLLAIQFGRRFERYANHTARLIPHVW